MKMSAEELVEDWDFNMDVHKMFLLILDIISSTLFVLLQAIGNNNGLAVGSVVTFGLAGFAAVYGFCIINVIISAGVEESRPNDGHWVLYSIANTAVGFGGLLYLVGDNLAPILSAFNDKISCDATCVINAQRAGKCLLFAALLCFRVIPPCFKTWSKADKRKRNFKKLNVNSEEHSHGSRLISFVVHMFAMMLEYDAAYSIVWGIDSFTGVGTCTTSELNSSWAAWGVALFIWLVYVCFNVVIFLINAEDDYICEYICIFIPVIIFIFLTVGFYLLGDNDEPIGCSCNDGGLHVNTTVATAAAGCKAITGKRIRTGLMFASGVSFAVSMLCLLCVGAISDE